MPNLTALAEQAILFEHAYTVYPGDDQELLRRPVLALPRAGHAGRSLRPRLRPALATVLAERGYRTGLFHRAGSCTWAWTP